MSLSLRSESRTPARESPPVEEEQRESLSIVDAMFSALYRDGLAVVGEDDCRLALERDQADLLIVSRRFESKHREAILRAAQRSGCSVEFVEEIERLDRVGGIDCLLRYRVPTEASQPTT